MAAIEGFGAGDAPFALFHERLCEGHGGPTAASAKAQPMTATQGAGFQLMFKVSKSGL